MGVIKIASTVVKDVLNMFLGKIIKRKLGYEIDIKFDDLTFDTVDGKVYLNAKVNAEMEQDEFTRMMKSYIQG